MYLYVHANCFRFRGPSCLQLGPRKEEPPTEIPTVIPETDSEDEIIVVDEIAPKDDPGLAKPSTS